MLDLDFQELERIPLEQRGTSSTSYGCDENPLGN